MLGHTAGEEQLRQGLTSSQVDILRGRHVDELSAREKLDYANAAARPMPASRNAVRAEHKFRMNTEKLAGAVE